MDIVKSPWHSFLEDCQHRIKLTETLQISGRVTRVAGLVMEAVGLKLAIGSPCYVPLSSGHRLEVEVVGFGNDRLFLMPLGDVEGVQPGALVLPTETGKPPLQFFHTPKPAPTPVEHGRRLPVGEAFWMQRDGHWIAWGLYEDTQQRLCMCKQPIHYCANPSPAYLMSAFARSIAC